MDKEERMRRNALLDWQNELHYRQGILSLLDGNERTECEARIAECKRWIAEIQAIL